MTILISNLENLLEDMSDDEMQHVNGGTSAGCDICSVQFEQSRTITIPNNVTLPVTYEKVTSKFDTYFVP